MAGTGPSEDPILRRGSHPPLQTRPWRTEDREGCLRVFDSNVPESFHPDEREAFAAFLDDLPGPFLVLESADEIIGCGGVAPEPGAPGLFSLCWGMIRIDHQGKGLGRLLLEERIRACEREGSCEALRLETIPDTVGFFTKMGFRVAHSDPDGYGPGRARVVLRRPLSEPGRG